MSAGPEVLFEHGTIHTGDPRAPRASADVLTGIPAAVARKIC